MRTRKPDHSSVALALVGAVAVILSAAGSARAQNVTSDQAAGVLVFPKVVVDTSGLFHNGLAVDTVIQMVNNDDTTGRSLHCFWINANSRCSVSGTICDPTSSNPDLNCRTEGSVCTPDWRVRDFDVDFTPGQPIGFLASDAATALPCDGSTCPQQLGGIIGAGEDPFVGELKCIEVDNITDTNPVDRNDFSGSARIYEVSNVDPGSVDVREYNGIGIQALGLDTNDGNKTLCLGTEGDECATAEYASCPGTLILNHFFEDAFPFGDDAAVQTVLTLVPCTEDVELASTMTGQVPTVAQLAIFNEFEQRFSSSTSVECYLSIRLADLDTRVGTADNYSSIFSVGVQGTLTGQTRIRGVPSNAAFHGLLGVAEELYTGGPYPSGFSDAFNLNYDGSRPDGAGDVIRLP